MTVTLALDGLFCGAFGTGMLAVLIAGVRITTMSQNHGVAVLSAVFAITAALSTGLTYAWAFIHLRRRPTSSPRLRDWREVIRRYPVFVGPAAYYLGAYRAQNIGHAAWFV